MKIGILTYQFADNYGAVLQCFALNKVINSMPNCEAQIINYVPINFSYQVTWKNAYEKVLFNRKRKAFEQFLNRYCKMDTPVINRIQEANGYDCYCVGSDQIWNTSKKYLAYFLPDISWKCKKIAYAASLGWSPDDDRLDKFVLKQYLPEFDAISVREDIHVPLIESIIGKKCHCVLDPSFLLDELSYQEIIIKQKKRDDKFIFFFWLPNDLTLMRGVEFVNGLSRKYNWPIVHTINSAPQNLFHMDGGDMQFESIESFLWYIQNAEIIVTNSYHATNFSIIFQKPFYTFIVNSMRARIDTLVSKLGIGNRVIETYLCVEQADLAVDYTNINIKLAVEKQKSMNYLRKALEIGEKL